MPRRTTDSAAPRTLALAPGLFGADRVDVAYVPWQARATMAVRVGPSSGSPVVLADSGAPVQLVNGQHFGRQTVRNPRCLDAPPLRAAINGFVWGYGMPPAIRKSGWVRLVDMQADPTCEQLACGPAGEDFDRRFPQACGGHCDGRPLTDVRPVAGPARVSARDLYLRYAPGSTAYRYLVGGDEIRLLANWRGGRWLGVEVRRAQWAPRGARGWILASGVTRG